MCFTSGQFGHREAGCPLGKKTTQSRTSEEQEAAASITSMESQRTTKHMEESSKFGPWMVVQRGSWRAQRAPMGKNVHPPSLSTTTERNDMSERGMQFKPSSPTVVNVVPKS